ncbi:MAG: pilus assembly protein N-terminal domain-containing protein [Alphaproteobacteria bacterium]|nr:pilus assembly protein N-terminal domain-containing protein [Alphaproteobacteria bacterium]MBU2094209.1 pilus assembly protein N-terminal domain-containing protein [Alphaproteobacteria bacterium]MBU2154214.1 pilus assembly protein N-terminal domain-containing protein [Alphaproteobacteria bacterium]MBU2307379.1 pilus assembly protein N-terminal domain-containing protein [Alphaproteobacteria bacterium]MBU2365912.1 pilus assembly protein N-terminal domain-containing protein [Alphaproteobacteria
MALSPAAQAQELASETVPGETLQAPLDMAVGLRANGPVGKVVLSQPETAQVGLAGEDGLYVIGSQPGATNLLVYDRQGRLSQTLDIQVAPDAHALRELLADALPGEPIVVTGLSSSLMLEGEVSSPSVVAIAETLAERFAPDGVISRLHARRNQVLLDVRIMEVSSRSLREINTAIAITNGPELAVAVGSGGIGLDTPHGVGRFRTSSGRLSLDATVRALEDKGQLRVVAQPSLVALSGETASFRAGGEFPFPVPTDDSKIQIEFRPYGAAMSFRPVVQENGVIRVALDTELSDIDPTVTLRLAGFTVPGLKIRRVSTTADLRDGEAFLIAGLYEDSSQHLSREPPFLAGVPVLGRVLAPIFSAVRKREVHRELAIVVTPHISGQATSPLGERSLLAEVEPAPAAVADPPRTPKSVSAPRGPPLRAFMAEVRDTLRPPVRWVKQAASRFTSALLGRA